MPTTLASLTIDEVLDKLPVIVPGPLPTPEYRHEHSNSARVMLAVEDMQRHMTDEGWQIALALQSAGYRIAGRRCEIDSVDVNEIVKSIEAGCVVMQDKREWDVDSKNFRDPTAKFIRHRRLADWHDVFKLTILKDSHQRPGYHAESAREIGCHAWIIYYHPRIVSRLASYVRPQHLVRTYHSLDPAVVPEFNNIRRGALLSGALSGVYPLRMRLVKSLNRLPKVQWVRHPGYHNKGCCTPDFLRNLSQFKVAICTASVYGYALRKIIEATACGCQVITDLPSDEVLPEIDDNLIRVHPDIAVNDLAALLQELYTSYDKGLQRERAQRAIMYYNYCSIGQRLATDIETLRSNYQC